MALTLKLVSLSVAVSALAAVASPILADDAKINIGVLFPDNQTPTWEQRHWPSIRDSIMKECPECNVIYGNVAGDPNEQRNVADSMFAQDIKALVLAPVNGAAAGVIVEDAKARGIPVIAYGSIPEGPLSAFVGLDITEIGRVQGKALLDILTAGGDPKRGCVVAINGDAQNAATQLFIDGRKEVLDPYVDICKEFWTPNWSAENAQTEMDQAITALGRDKIIGVYSMNDGMASGVAAAMKNAGFTDPLPPLTGLDADLGALQRLLVGEQAFSVDQQAPIWGQAAGPVAVAAARGQELKSDKTEKNSEYTFPWFTTPPMVIVTKDTIKQDIIDKGYRTVDEICTADYEEACKAAGLK